VRRLRQFSSFFFSSRERKSLLTRISHDLTDFEGLLENVPKRVFERNLETVIPVRLRRQEVEEVKRVAKTRGVRESALLR